MRIGVSLEYTDCKDVNNLPSNIDEAEKIANDKLSELSGIYNPEFRYAPQNLIPINNVELRQKAFNLYKNIIPKDYYPCYESLYIDNVTYDDIMASPHLITLSIFPSPGEDECENSKKTDFSNEYKCCPDCNKKRMQSGHIRNISFSVIKKYKGVLEFPNGDTFCFKTFIQKIVENGLTGMDFSVFKKNKLWGTIYKITIPDHDWVTVSYSCKSCKSLATTSLHDLFNSKESFHHDIQMFNWYNGKGFILSQRMVELIYPFNQRLVSSAIPIMPEYKMELPLQSTCDR